MKELHDFCFHGFYWKKNSNPMSQQIFQIQKECQSHSCPTIATYYLAYLRTYLIPWNVTSIELRFHLQLCPSKGWSLAKWNPMKCDINWVEVFISNSVLPKDDHWPNGIPSSQYFLWINMGNFWGWWWFGNSNKFCFLSSFLLFQTWLVYY